MKQNIDQRIKRLLGEKPSEWTATEVAAALEISPSTARHHLSALAQCEDIAKSKRRVDGVTSYWYSIPAPAVERHTHATDNGKTTAPAETVSLATDTKYLYRGEKITIPDGPWTWIATDGDGDVVLFEGEPKPLGDLPWFLRIGYALVKPASTGHENITVPDWKDSAQRIDTLYRVWNGGECPVDNGTPVDVIYRDGVENLHVRAGHIVGAGGSCSRIACDWDSLGDSGDDSGIVAYRLHQPEAASAQEAKEAPSAPYPTIPADAWPEWAKFHANDSDGKGFFFESRPVINRSVWSEDSDDGELQRSIFETNGEGWRDSLIERPADNVVDAEFTPEERKPEDVAPTLWNAYKDRLDDVALDALRDVILNQWEKVGLSDANSVGFAFAFKGTTQGLDFWRSVAEGHHDRKATAEPMPSADYELVAETRKQRVDEAIGDLLANVFEAVRFPAGNFVVSGRRLEDGRVRVCQIESGSMGSKFVSDEQELSSCERYIESVDTVQTPDDFAPLTTEQVDALLSGKRMAKCGGQPVTALTRFDTHATRLVGIVEGGLRVWDEFGKHIKVFIDAEGAQGHLVMAPITYELFINVYPGRVFKIQDTRESADYSARSDRIDCIRIEWDEK